MSECDRKCCYKSRCTWYGFMRNVYGFFGTVWADIGIGGLRVSVAIWLMILAILIGAALFFSGIMMIRQSRHLPNKKTLRNAKNVDQWFNIVFTIEFVLIGVAAIVTNVIGY